MLLFVFFHFKFMGDIDYWGVASLVPGARLTGLMLGHPDIALYYIYNLWPQGLKAEDFEVFPIKSIEALGPQ